MTPAMMNGTVNINVSGSTLIKYPFNPIPILNPTDLAIFVIPFAALLSELETTKFTYVCLAGTSICEIQNRPKIRIIAIYEFEANGMIRRKIFDGR